MSELTADALDHIYRRLQLVATIARINGHQTRWLVIRWLQYQTMGLCLRLGGNG